VRIGIILFGLLSLVDPTVSKAATIPCLEQKNTGKEIVVVFVNGINSKRDEACASMAGLDKKLSSFDGIKKPFDYQLSYNPSNGLKPDLDELLLQAKISDNAILRSQTDVTILGRQKTRDGRYYLALGSHYVQQTRALRHTDPTEQAVYSSARDLYNILKMLINGKAKKVVVVAHSQGNFLIEAAYAMFFYHNELPFIERLQVVGVGPVSYSTPMRVYVTALDDLAVGMYGLQAGKFKYFVPLVANLPVCYSKLLQNSCDPGVKVASKDRYAHAFLNIYLNPYVLDSRTRVSVSTAVAGHVARAMDKLGEVDVLPPYDKPLEEASVCRDQLPPEDDSNYELECH
jgi:hypothetical protein